ncbi:hypothetical protein QT971_30990 [Microcoleus sp. herbarium19]|uniref:hypothetical protein n=1 Tax=unclassified Microcoleus TaxID=2642155 RepID=UPI002FCFE734
MSKFEELCKAYAASRQAYRESCQACLDFSAIFIKQLSDYLECPIHKQNPKFDSDGVLHFDAAIDICENPENPEKGDRETVEISLSVNKVIDNFIVTVYPWGHEFKILIDEPRHFKEAFEYIFDTIKSAYTGASELPSAPDPVPF